MSGEWSDAELLAAALERTSGVRAVDGNRVQLLVDGPAAYPAMMAVIEGARERIRFENYIIRSDATGRRFADALIARARAGVEIKVLADWLGSIGTSGGYWKKMRAAGIEVRQFHRLNPLRLFNNLSRDHRKLVVGDGQRAVIGGLCIGDEWDGDAARQLLPWRDTAVLVEGPGAALLENAFADT